MSQPSNYRVTFAAIAVVALWVAPGLTQATVVGTNGYVTANMENLLSSAVPSTTGVGSPTNGQNHAGELADGNVSFARLRITTASGNPTDGVFHLDRNGMEIRTLVTMRAGGPSLGVAHVNVGATNDVQVLPTNSGVITTTSLNSAIVANSVTISYPTGLGDLGGNLYVSDMYETMAYSEKLTQITGISVTAQSPGFSVPPSSLYDGNIDNPWYAEGGAAYTGERFVEANLPSTKNIGAIVLINGNSGVSTYTAHLQRWTGTGWETFADAAETPGAITSFTIDGGVTTSKIRILVDAGAQFRGFSEVMLFEQQAIPEPSTLGLAAVAACGMVARRRR
jgi:hypothetical protein